MSLPPFVVSGRRLPRRARALLAALTSATLSLAACGERSAPPPAESLQAGVADSLQGPGQRQGTWQGADASSTWAAVLDGPRITQVDEVARFTDSTLALRQFRFDSTGALSWAREERRQAVYGATATPDSIVTKLELEWVSDSLVRSAKRVNGVDRLLQPYEVDNLRTHADDLLRAARAGAPSRTPGS